MAPPNKESNERKRKIAVTLASLALVLAMIVVIAVGISTTLSDDDSDEDSSHESEEEENHEISSSKKVVERMCEPTTYKEACVHTLTPRASMSSSSPNDLIKVSFQATRASLAHALRNSTSLAASPLDHRANQALIICEEAGIDSLNELKKTVESLSEGLEGDAMMNPGQFLEDIRVWTSGVLAFHEICIDSFENTTSDAGKRMKELLETSRELATNALTIISRAVSVMDQLGIPQEGGEGEGEGEGKGSHHAEGSKGEDGGKGEGSHHAKGEEGGGEGEGSHPDKGEGGGEEGSNHDGRRRLSEEQQHQSEEQQHQSEDQHQSEEQQHQSEEQQHQSEDSNLAGKIPEWISEEKRKIMTVPVSKIKVDVVVAKDGSGKVTTITEALELIPEKNTATFIIYIKEGVYNEHVHIKTLTEGVIFIGDGPQKTRISQNRNFADGYQMYRTATAAILGNGFMARDIGFDNSAGPEKQQAVAARVISDYSVFYNCEFTGHRSTLYTVMKRQFYRDCTISGTVDFIFGDALALFQNCKIIIRKPLDGQQCIVTSQGRTTADGPSAIILHNCTITADKDFPPQIKAYLGRPWKNYSRTVVMQSQIDDVIAPQGWAPFSGKFALNTAYFAEYNNRGKGAVLGNRVKWAAVKKISKEQAEKYTPGKYFDDADGWIKPTGCPYYPDMLPKLE